MSDALTERLNKIQLRITADDFLTGAGIGNEIGFYIFDYMPEDELRVRDHIRFLLERIPKQKPELRVKHVNLFDMVLEYLKSRNILEKALKIQREKGNAELKKALVGPLAEERLAAYFEGYAQPASHDLVLMSGVGSVYPLVRTHSLLSNLHKIMGQTPLVMFYPGKYDQMTLRLFGKLSLSSTLETVAGKTKRQEHYYRAFKLVP